MSFLFPFSFARRKNKNKTHSVCAMEQIIQYIERNRSQIEVDNPTTNCVLNVERENEKIPSDWENKREKQKNKQRKNA